MTQVTLGELVADFEAASTDGTFRLSEQRGRIVVLYFYPKDNTPGCTTQSQNFRDLHDEFEAAGARVVGVSRDSLKSHENFCERHTLPFTLISDPDEVLCTQFDVMKLKNMYGKQVRGIERSTFIIDAEGRLVKEWRKVRVPGHVDAVLEAVRALSA